MDVLAGIAPQVVPAYRAMARRTTARALGSGRISDDTAGEILDVLATAGTGLTAGEAAGEGS